MRRSQVKSLWGEYPDTYDSKYEVDDVFSIYPPEKRFKIEMLPEVEEPEEAKTVEVENHCVAQTVELLNHTNRINSMIQKYSAEMYYILSQGQVLPTIILSEDTKSFIKELGQPIPSPFQIREDTDFSLGKTESYPHIKKPVVTELLGKAICGLLRIQNVELCTDGALEMFKEAVQEFYTSLFEKINHVIATEGNDTNKEIDIDSLEKAHHAVTNTSILSLHNYYKNGIINRNRSEIFRFQNAYYEYGRLIDQSIRIQELSMKQEYEDIINESNQNDDFSQSSSSDASSSFSYKESNLSYDYRQQSDDYNEYSEP